MRIILLDIDGVLNNPASLMNNNGPDSACVAQLNRIIVATGARIVVSSVWRGMRNIKSILKAWGVVGNVIGVTPSIPGATRGEEIGTWLNSPAGIAVTAFVILDDDSDMGMLMPHLVRTNYKVGLTAKDAEAAIAILRDGVG